MVRERPVFDPEAKFSKKALFTSAFFVVCVFFASSSSASTCPPLAVADQGIIKQVIDGDTVHLTDGRKVRLLGINTPEIDHKHGSSEPFAEEARNFLKSLVPAGTRVKLKFDQQRHDRYQRLLAHLAMIDGRNPGQLLVEQGLATVLVIPPNTASAACYLTAQQHARNQGLGIWNHPRYAITPASKIGPGTDTPGYQRISGQVNRVSQSRKYHYLVLGEHLAVRINKQHWQDYFLQPLKPGWPGANDPRQLLGHTLVVSGWLHQARNAAKQQDHAYQKPLQMKIKHPAGLEWQP
ncbi:MAG: thermonuclease family protein [Immundisolibacteraceae bacterium]|nr:thermonuclease family protein [Immundisolibacteraceae bacterium]